MSERYRRILSIDNRYWDKKCPIIIEKGALLLDSQKNQALLQFKFYTNCSETIIAFSLLINCFDIGDNDLGLIEHQYLDLKTSSYISFGSDIGIYLTNLNARKFTYVIKDIVYESNNIDKSCYSLCEIAPIQNIQSLGIYTSIYKNDFPNALVIPFKASNYWICNCGAINNLDEKACIKCTNNKEKIFSCISQSYLEEKSKAIEAQKAIEQKKLEESRQIRNRKIKKIAIPTIAIAIIILVLYYSIPKIIVFVKYNNAEKALLNKDFDTAIELYSELDDYKDSESKKELAKDEKIYYDAVTTIQESTDYANIADAIEDLESLGSFYNSQEMISLGNDRLKELSYENAIAIIQQSDSYEDVLSAVQTLRKIPDYQDSSTYISQGEARLLEIKSEETYNNAEELSKDDSTWEEAANLYTSLGDYKDSKSKASSLYQALADQNYELCNYANAVIYYEKAELTDSEKYKASCYYAGKSSYETGDYSTACTMFSKIPGYEDANNLLTDCNTQIELADSYDDAVYKLQHNMVDEAYAILVTLPSSYKNTSSLLAKASKYLGLSSSWICTGYEASLKKWITDPELTSKHHIEIKVYIDDEKEEITVIIDDHSYTDGHKSSYGYMIEITLSNGVLTITGTGIADSYTFNTKTGLLTYTINGQTSKEQYEKE